MPRLLASGLSSLRYVARALGGFQLLLNVVAVVVAAIVAVDPGSRVAAVAMLVLTAVLLGRIAWELRADRRAESADRLQMGTKNLSRVLQVVAALTVEAADGRHLGTDLAGGLILVLLIGESAMRRPVRSAVPQIANVEGWDVPLPLTSLANWFFGVNTLAGTLLAALAVADTTQLPTILVTLVGVGLAVMIGLQSARYLVRRRRYEANLPKILAEIGPVFAFHWQAPAGTAYQAAMWLPYLERIGVPFIVLTRTAANFKEVAQMTSAPVILRIGLEDLDPIVTPSLKAVFYANTAVRNSHMIRFPYLTHIQLNHGDSDKIASVSPTFRQYDRNFVAGQAAIDRFAQHGVSTQPDQFEIVGRPQLEHVVPATGPIADVETPTVLYSPTWSGFYEDSDYSSLSAGPAIVGALIDRGSTVVFRPHPYARRHPGNTAACRAIIELLEADAAQSGRAHVFGPVAETEMSIVDCFNACDAMISDVSSVVSDFLISTKPFAMGAVSAHGEAFVEEFPLARAAYVFDVRGREAVGIDELLAQMLGPDPKAATRRELRSYYLSDTPPEQIAERFLETARRYLGAGR